MSLLQALELICRVDKDAVSLIVVDMDVDIRGRDRLHVNLGTITEQVG